MKLNIEQIRSVAIGAVRVEEHDGLIRLYRFTKAQEDAYKPHSEDFWNKTFSTAGIRLEFITDSKTLGISASVSSASSRKFFAIDVYANGEHVGRVGSDTENCGTFEGSFELGEGEKELAVYLPWSACAALKEITLDDGASLTPIEKSCRMIMFGDSITHGYDAKVPAASYASIVADALDANAVNKGIGGEKFFPELATLHDGFEPDIITVAYGTNDWSGNTLEVFERDSLAFYRNLSATYPKAKIFALAPIWRKDFDRENKKFEFSHVAEHFDRIAKELDNVTLINCYGFVPEDPELFSDKYLHPNDEGFSYYAEGLLTELKKYL